nr:MAG TPA: helix-turn-helix domain protein [Caudoviricetes sp.]
MRYCATEAAALQGLKHSTKVVALTLAARTSNNNPDWPGRYVSFPSIEALEEDTGLSRRSLYRAINELADANIIRIYKDRKPGAQWDHNVYEWTATESPNYDANWMKRRDTRQDAVGSRLTDEGWEYCRTHNVGPNIAAGRHPEFTLPQKAPSVIEVEEAQDEPADMLPIETPVAPIKPAKRASKATRNTAIAEDWRPSEKTLAHTRERYPSMPIDIEIEKFRDYHLSKGTKRSNWDASWRTWCTNGNSYADGAWAAEASMSAPTTGNLTSAINPNTGKPVTRDDFGYACLDAGIDPNLYIKFWKPYMGLPSDPGWPEWAAKIDRHCGRA